MADTRIYLAGIREKEVEGELEVMLHEKYDISAEVEVKTSHRSGVRYALLTVKEEEAPEIIRKLNFLQDDAITSREGFRARRYERNPPADKNFFVRNLPLGTTEKEVFDFFSQFGEVHSVSIGTDAATKLLRAYVQFLSMDDAVREEFTNNDATRLAQTYPGATISLFRSWQSRANNWTDVFVGNIPESWTLADVLRGLDGVLQNSTIFSEPHLIQTPAGVFPLRKAVIDFRTHEQAVEAVNHFREIHVTIGGCQMPLRAEPYKAREALAEQKVKRRVERAAMYRSHYPDCNIRIHNLPSGFTNENLLELVKTTGGMANVIRSRVCDSGTAYVLFETHEQALSKCASLQKVFVVDLCQRFNLPVPHMLTHGEDTHLSAMVVQSRAEREQALQLIAPTDKGPLSAPFDITIYEESTEDMKRNIRGNFAYPIIMRFLADRGLVSEANLAERTSQITGMIIDVEWESAEEFLELFRPENADNLLEQIKRGLEYIEESRK